MQNEANRKLRHAATHIRHAIDDTVAAEREDLAQQLRAVLANLEIDLPPAPPRRGIQSGNLAAPQSPGDRARREMAKRGCVSFKL